MHYTQEITIAAPRERIAELFTDPAHFSDWQPDLVCYELVSGDHAQTGTKAELTTRAGNRVTGHDRDGREQRPARRVRGHLRDPRRVEP